MSLFTVCNPIGCLTQDIYIRNDFIVSWCRIYILTIILYKISEIHIEIRYALQLGLNSRKYVSKPIQFENFQHTTKLFRCYLNLILWILVDLFQWIAPPTLETKKEYRNCKGVQSSGTMHQHLTAICTKNASHGIEGWFKTLNIFDIMFYYSHFKIWSIYETQTKYNWTRYMI